MQWLARYIGEIVYGANDGIITTFAVVTAAAGGQLSAGVIVILGVANLLADGFSMGASNFLSERAEAARDRDTDGSTASAVAEPFKRAVATFVAFNVAGILPLFPYLINPAGNGRDLLVWSIGATALALALVGVGRAYLARESVIVAVGEMLFVGGIAATISYGVGWFIRTVVGVVA